MDAPSKLVIPLGSLDGLPRGTAVATTVSTCQVVHEDTRLRAAGSASRRAAGRPSPLRTASWAWTTYFRPASRAAPPYRCLVSRWRRSDVTDERSHRRNPASDQRPDPNEEFRRRLERETDLSLRGDPERRRFYRSGDLPRSG